MRALRTVFAAVAAALFAVACQPPPEPVRRPMPEPNSEPVIDPDDPVAETPLPLRVPSVGWPPMP